MPNPLLTHQQLWDHHGHKVWAIVELPDPANESRAKRIRKSGILHVFRRPHLTASLKKRGYTTISSLQLEGFRREFSIDCKRFDTNSGCISVSDNGMSIYLFNSRKDREEWVVERIQRRAIPGATIEDQFKIKPI